MKYQIISIASVHAFKINEYVPKCYKVISITGDQLQGFTILLKKKFLGVF